MQDLKNTTIIINRSNLIKVLTEKHTDLPCNTISKVIKHIFEVMTNALVKANKIELRGFGSFCVRFHPARLARNPKTGEKIKMRSKYTVHFKPGKKLNAKVNNK